MKKSLNIPALKTAQAVGLDKSKAFAEGLGMTFKDNTVYESTAIGSNTASPLQVAGAYAAYGNEGNYNKPHFVTKVVFPDGKEKSFKPKEERVMKDYTAFMITDVLRDVVKPGSGGTGPTAYVSGIDVAGKTGTQNFDPDTLKNIIFQKVLTEIVGLQVIHRNIRCRYGQGMKEILKKTIFQINHLRSE